MITFDQLLTEVNKKSLLNEEVTFYQYSALVRITYDRDSGQRIGAEKIAELLRAVPGGTRVSTSSLDKEHGIGIFNVRLISQKSPKEAFIAFKKNCLKKYKSVIRNVEIGEGTIETKNFVS